MARMKIYSTPCQSGAHASSHADQTLRRLHALSREKLHDLVADPAEADFIFLSNLPLDVEQREVRDHPLVRKYLHKTYAFWDAWNTPYLLPGVYVNATRGSGLGRFRTVSYALLHPDFKNPLIENFGRPPLERQPDLLFSFLGRNCHPSRDTIFKTQYRRSDLFIEDTSRFDAFTHANEGKEPAQRHYLEVCLRSKFILCPRGVGASSIRLFEALRLGIAPIIVSDAWMPCVGPDWNRCAIFIKEAEVHRLEEIVSAHEHRWAEMGRAAREIHDHYFADDVYFNFLVANIESVAKSRVVPERVVSWLWPLTIAKYKARRRWTSLPPGTRARYLTSRIFEKLRIIKVRTPTVLTF